MKLTKLLERLDYEVLQGSDEIEITEFTNDSRKEMHEGSAFVCIKGAVFDGHDYVADMAAKGASAVIVERDVEAPEGLTVIKVADTRYAQALASAAYFGYPADELKVIGITGTKGKTTTTYMVKSILEGVGHKVGLIGTIESIIGDEVIPSKNTTPESFTIHEYFRKMVDAGCDCVVMEVSSQGLMLHRTAGIPFEIGIFTNLGEDHIGPNEHADFEDYKRCKGLLFKQCKLGIANVDDAHFEDVFKEASCKIETFGFSENADLRATDVRLVSTPGHLGVAYKASGLMNFDVEIDKEALNRMAVATGQAKPNIEMFQFADGRKVYLLGEGRLVNLAAGDGHPAEIMDLTFALQALSLEYVLQHPELENTVHSVPKEIDERVARIKLQALNVTIDTLTDEQQEYLNSWQL